MKTPKKPDLNAPEWNVPLFMTHCDRCGQRAPVLPGTVDGTVMRRFADHGPCAAGGQPVPADSRYLRAMLVDDHPGSRLAREANVIALLFRMEEDSHYPTVVSVGPPGYGKINGDDMLAHVIPLTWEAPPICVNEVRGDHLTTRAMYTLTGSELPNLKYSGELAIGRHHWLVMVPPCVSLIGLHDIVTVARMQPPVERAANPIGVRIESTFRHLNRHPDCQCAWTRWARL